MIRSFIDISLKFLFDMMISYIRVLLIKVLRTLVKKYKRKNISLKILNIIKYTNSHEIFSFFFFLNQCPSIPFYISSCTL